MSSPLEAVSVQPAALHALATELTTLAGELASDAELCRSTGRSFATALAGDEDWTTQRCSLAWATAEELLAGGARALAATLADVAARYADEDDALAAGIRAGRRYGAPGSR
jgi:hypothetical protein